MLPPTLFPASLEKAGPKHSTRVPSSSEVAVPVNVDEKEVALVPNPVPDVTVKGLPDPQGPGRSAVLCTRVHSLLPPTLQMVIPFLFPITVHVKVKVSPGQVGGGAVNCPATTPRDRPMRGNIFLLYAHTQTTIAGFHTGIEVKGVQGLPEQMALGGGGLRSLRVCLYAWSRKIVV